MSGGSFNYLAFANDVEEMFGKMGDLEDMINSLKGETNRPIAKDIALRLQLMYDDLEWFRKVIERRWDRNSKIMKAYEWFVSCDWGWEQVEETYKEMIENVD